MAEQQMEILEEQAKAADGLADQALVENAPSGKFSKEALGTLLQSLNSILAMFGAEPLDMIDGDLEGPIPPPVFKALLMINAALQDGGMGEMDLSKATDDKGLKMIAGRLNALVKDKAFMAFINKPQEGRQTMTEEIIESPPGDDMEAVAMESTIRGPTQPDIDEEQLMMSRMT